MFYPFELERYLGDLLPEQDALLKELEAEALKETIPIVTPPVGHFLALLVRLKNAQNILEIGTATGYSTIWMGRAALDVGGRITTIDLNEGRRQRAIENFQKAKIDHIITSLSGDARNVLPDLKEQFDFIFVDAAKGEYDDYFSLIKPLLKPEGLMVVDNVLFRGWVVPGSTFEPKYDRMVGRLRCFLDRLKQDPDFQTTVLPFGDGLSLSLKRTD